jgi:hypothetical protein
MGKVAVNKDLYGTGLYQDGVFYFTNPGLFKMRQEDGTMTADFTTLWNNKEYIFQAETTVPLVIANEPPENIQHIRKQFAKNYAQAWFHQTPRYKKLVKDGKNLPATYNEDTEFKAVIQACLTPLPKGQMTVKDLPKDSEDNYKGSKAIRPGQDLNQLFKDYEPPTLGEM